MGEVDAVSYHPYSFSALSSTAIFARFKTLVSDYQFDNKIWVTEVGFPTGGDYLSKVPEEKMPEEVVKAIVSLAVGGARHMFWYQLFDPAERNPGDSEDYFGLVNHDYSYKQGADAYALCGRYIPGTTYRPALPEHSGNPGSIQSFYFEGGEENTLVIWRDGGESEPIGARITLPGTGRQRHDPVTGKSEPIDGETTSISLGAIPHMYTWENRDRTNPPRLSVP
jgi:hypothetical protein